MTRSGAQISGVIRKLRRILYEVIWDMGRSLIFMLTTNQQVKVIHIEFPHITWWVRVMRVHMIWCKKWEYGVFLVHIGKLISE